MRRDSRQHRCVRGRPGPAGQRGCRVYGPLSVHCRRRPGRPAPPDHRGPHDRQSRLRRWLARAGPRGGRPGRPADTGQRTGGRCLLPSADPAGPRRPTALDCTNFAPRPATRRAADRPSRGAGQRIQVLTRTAGKAVHAGQAGSRLPLSAGNVCAQISRATGCRDTPGGTSAAAFVPDAPGRIDVPSHDNVPGQIRAQIGPLDHPPRSPRGQGPCDRNPPCNLTR
jgi:hypothetical protein